MLSSTQILDALANHGAPGQRGRLAALERQLGSTPQNSPTPTPASHRDLLGNLLAAATAAQESSTRRTLTGRTWTPAGDGSRGAAEAARRFGTPTPIGTGMLTAADIAWISRLPDNPAAVAPADVATLLGLAARATPGGGDARFLAQVLDPVMRHHEQTEAKAALKEARRSQPAIPAQLARDALTDAIAVENPGLTRDDARNRARAAVDQLVANRAAVHERAVQAALARVGAAT